LRFPFKAFPFPHPSGRSGGVAGRASPAAGRVVDDLTAELPAPGTRGIDALDPVFAWKAA
jgi:hypothetical protein